MKYVCHFCRSVASCPSPRRSASKNAATLCEAAMVPTTMGKPVVTATIAVRIVASRQSAVAVIAPLVGRPIHECGCRYEEVEVHSSAEFEWEGQRECGRHLDLPRVAWWSRGQTSPCTQVGDDGRNAVRCCLHRRPPATMSMHVTVATLKVAIARPGS